MYIWEFAVSLCVGSEYIVEALSSPELHFFFPLDEKKIHIYFDFFSLQVLFFNFNQS